MNVGAAGTVSELGSPLHPGRPLGERGGAEAGPARSPGSGRPGPPGPSRPVTTRWWPDGTAWPLRHSPKPGQSWAGRTSWPPPSGSRRTSSSVHWRARPGTRRGSSYAFRTTVNARGIGGLLEDYAFCADGFWRCTRSREGALVRLSEAVISAAGRRFVAAGTAGGHRRGTEQVRAAQGGQAGLDPFDNATPSGAAAFAGALLSYAALSGSAEHRGHSPPRSSALLPPLADRAPRVAGWLLATAQAALAGPVEAAVVGPARS